MVIKRGEIWWANVSQVVTIDKSFLTEKLGKLPSANIKKIEEGIRLVLSL